MSASAWSAVGGVAAAVVVLLTAVGGFAWWLYRRGGQAGKLTSTIETAVSAVQENTTETRKLSNEFVAHRAKTDLLLEEHQRMLVQHDKRLSGLERGGSTVINVNPAVTEGSA